MALIHSATTAHVPARPYIIGIDPGFTGALAVVHAKDPSMSAVYDMPTHTIDKTKSRPMGRVGVNADALSALIDKYHSQSLMAVVEELDARPGQSAQAMWRFATGYGMVLGVLAAKGIMVFSVKPIIWKTNLNLSANKSESLVLARKHFPHLAKTTLNLAKHDGRAEALLLAHYGVRMLA